MKKILYLILFLAILFFVFSASSAGFFAREGSFFYRSVCDMPIAYKVGNIDQRFNLSKDEVIENLDRAAAVWEKQSGRDLFTYDASGDLTVNFIYDRKQSLHSQISDLEEKLDNGKGDLDAKKVEYESQVLEFNKKVDELNSEVQKWNSQGGAPQDEYERLVLRQTELRSEAEKLNNTAKELNLSTREYNLEVGKLNKQIGEFNQDLKVRPEEGLFDGETNTIEIYFVPSEDELVHTLAHELGHARGLGHLVTNENSIMFPSSSESTELSIEDFDAMTALCKERSLPQIARDNVIYVVQRYKGLR